MADENVFQICIVLCWAIWPARNKKLFEGQPLDAMEVISFVKYYGNFFSQPRRRVLSTNFIGAECVSHWQTPSFDVIKINFDAAINRPEVIIGFGLVARTHTESVVGWSTSCLYQYLDSNSAEAKAALMAVEFAQRKGWRKIVIEGDSSTVIAAIVGGKEDKSMYGSVVRNIQRAASSFQSFSVRHVRRTGNQVAYEVARLSFRGSCILAELPSPFRDIVISDIGSRGLS